ncbi:MAG: DUF2135 domain-containing protein [Myxococcales bacterium]|nr:DUF2135 domain-containing protein [Myxococcales bacterium]
MDMMMAEAAAAPEEPFAASAEPNGIVAEKAEAKGGGSARASISIKPWSPDTPYLTEMRRAEDPYAAYLAARPEFAASPAFFLDCGDFLLSQGARELGLRVLSNLLELGLDDPALMRMYAWRLSQAGELDAAARVLERVLHEREDEPQSHRDLALVLGDRWQRDGDPADATRAMELLYEVVLRQWERFPEIELIALMELNRLIHLARGRGVEIPEAIDRRVVQLLDLDVRISMSWDADLTDVDLHVFEPTGEHVYYGHNRSDIGGLVSRDFRQGYGPEEYVLRRAYPGVYAIKAHYYGSHQQKLTGACTVIVTVFTNYGRADEQRQVLTLRLERPRDQVTVGEITIAGSVDEARDATPQWRERFSRLERGMTLDAITGLVGQPASIGGEGEMVLIYRPERGVTIKVRVGPALRAVQAEVDGATIDLV